MNRRDFLSKFIVPGTATALAPLIYIPELSPAFIWKLIKKCLRLEGRGEIVEDIYNPLHPSPFEVLAARAEDLGPHLYIRAQWKDPWQNIIPRSEWPTGAGGVSVKESGYGIGLTMPTDDEARWDLPQI